MDTRIRSGWCSGVLAVLLVAAACSGGGGSKAPTNDAPAGPANNNQQQPAAPAAPAATTYTVKLVKYQACHTEKKAGGNSDGLAEFTTTAPDGSVVFVTFTSDDGTNVEGTAETEGGEFIVRFKLVRIGEKLTVKEIKIGDQTITDLDIEAFTVPSTSECDLSSKEATQNAN